MIAVSYLMKRKIKKIFLELVSNTNIFNIKFCSINMPTTKILSNLQGGLHNIEYGNNFYIDNLYIFHETLKSQYYIPGDSSFILNKAPNIIYRTDFSFYNKSAVATDEYITGDTIL